MAEYQQLSCGMDDGVQISTSAGKIGFFGATPVVQQTGFAVVATTGATTTTAINEVQAAVNTIRTILVNLGLTTTV